MPVVAAVKPRAERRHPEDMPADLLTVPQAARRLGLSSETLYRQIRANAFSPAVKIGSGIRISVPRLEAFLHGNSR